MTVRFHINHLMRLFVQMKSGAQANLKNDIYSCLGLARAAHHNIENPSIVTRDEGFWSENYIHFSPKISPRLKYCIVEFSR